MDTYVKVFGSILDSTIWQENLATKVVWITMLAMKDKNGYVGAAVPGLAHRAGVSVEECNAALKLFLAPDEYSRSKEHDGRRISVVNGGWMVLNHAIYRQKMSMDERRDYKRKKQAEYRARPKGKTKRQVANENSGREQRFIRAEEEGDEARAGEIAAEGLEGDELRETPVPYVVTGI